MTWRVGRSMVLRVFLDTVHAVTEEVRMPGIPLDDESALKDLADGFQLFRERENPLFGCVGT